jgi:hypothetical protein
MRLGEIIENSPSIGNSADNVKTSAPASAPAHVFLKALNDFMLSTVQKAPDVHLCERQLQLLSDIS